MTWTVQAIERAQRTVQATEVLRQHAATIANVCSETEGNQIIVAMVEVDGSFAGTQVIPRAELQNQLEILEIQEHKWVLALSPSSSIHDIERRCADIGYFANRRRSAIQRRLDQQH
ncbi:hypothetical protein KSD_95650 [Ktedonobacter sp. SOSP1-85]|jgi:hypothetical protein|uniref:Uncharacterized protein n=2 Tax=Ktedonobacter TaxID=363276 RepID=D6U1M7_KTERA|nr:MULTISPECIES: hypothetical protein [Ktedonobacter]EFH82671.1 hypothetical protein Krac_3507 [Ktedonobacter racemifer DSM 44963]GHO58569.1 hypothetical protein KSB_70440 [Ktedonobacter robiniae]GHO71150.1 hypothetical protein KSC_100420 [Ktedonobacter sp. SOSP1-52]GHO81794.1 hypothetical protein KSD_95650 [Ktedonobacter sp. SOSP1-85]